MGSVFADYLEHNSNECMTEQFLFFYEAANISACKCMIRSVSGVI
jgi:hypothetical protein